MRAVLVSSNFRPHVGGIERFTEVLAEGLAGRGHEVTVVCCRDGAAPLVEDSAYRVLRVPASYALDRRLNLPVPVPEPLQLVRTLGRALEGADVVHVQDAIYLTSLPALALARRRRIGSVLTQHVAFVPQSSGLKDALQHAVHATLGRSARLATRVATLNPAVAEWVERTWGGRDVRVLPVGTPPPRAAAPSWRGPAAASAGRSRRR